MKDDPAIQAVRDARKRISEAVGGEPRKLVEYYQRLHRERMLARTPRVAPHDLGASEEHS